MPHPLLIILGPTASGKTALAASLANEFDAEIISADSRQIFRGMDIGTGKDLATYSTNHGHIPYHLIDIRNAGEKYHVHAFINDFYEVFNNITSRHKIPLLCGGTGMYIHSLLQNHELTAVPVNAALRDKLSALEKTDLIAKLDSYETKNQSKVDYSSMKRLIRAIEIAEYLSIHQLNIVERPPIKPFIIGLTGEVAERRQRILKRLKDRLNNGLIAEVESLLKQGVSQEILIFYGLEYKFIVAYLNGELNRDQLEERLGIAICQFAKRQMTFFRKMEKDGVKINWLTADLDFNEVKKNAIQLVNNEFDSK
jgi:tRNA dimethylallyltransferase